MGVQGDVLRHAHIVIAQFVTKMCHILTQRASCTKYIVIYLPHTRSTQRSNMISISDIVHTCGHHHLGPAKTTISCNFEIWGRDPWAFERPTTTRHVRYATSDDPIDIYSSH